MLKKTILFFTIACLFFDISFAQTIQRNLLARFSLNDISAALISKEQWKPFPTTPEGWKKVLPDTLLKQLIGLGEEAVKMPFLSISASVALEYQQNGNRSNYERQSFTKRNQLMDMVIAESIEGKGRFTQQIMNGVWSICEESFWGVSAHVGTQKAGVGLPDVEDITVDLFSAETGAVLALTDYFVGVQLEKISKLIRPRIYYEVNRRILLPLENNSDRYGYLGNGKRDVKVNNWNPWIISNWMAANLLLEKDAARRSKTVQHQLSLLDLYINGLGDDGATDEGPGYWFAAGGCVFDALSILDNATKGKLTIYNEPIIQKMGAYIYQSHIKGPYFINVADAAPRITPDGIMLYRFGKSVQDTQMQQFGSWAQHTYSSSKPTHEQFYRTRKLFNLLATKDCDNYPPREVMVRDVWLPDIQLMAARLNNGLYVASHAGHNGESHNHNDVGDILVYDEGYPVIIDVGAGTYTSKTFSSARYSLWFNTSPYHNLPTINGQEQKAGKQFTATDVAYAMNEGSARFRMNIAKAWGEEAGLLSWIRTLDADRNKGITITDDYELKQKPVTLIQSFMTTCLVNIDTPGQLLFEEPGGRKVVLSFNAKEWRASKEKLPMNQPEDTKFAATWEGKDIWRVVLTNMALEQKGKIMYVIKLLPS
jgi:hypothetical protein